MIDEVGQLVITGIAGTVLTDSEKSFLKEGNLGGVILFSPNFESPRQLAELTNDIQENRDKKPLYIAVDQEGGRVVRFKEYFSKIPSMLDLAKLDSPKTVFEVGNLMAKELKRCGVNLNLAPVCDIFNNSENKVIGDRAFGKNQEDVSKYISSIIRGFLTNNLLSCAKHFPGHGCTLEDSHFYLPAINKSLDELRKCEFLPFIKAVNSKVDFVMMAHLQVDSIDSEYPTSLSKKAYDLLRKELNFSKLIITDDMEMQALTDHYSIEEAAVLAIKAGADLIEYRSMEKASRALLALKNAVQSGELKEEVVADRLKRIYLSKKNLGSSSSLKVELSGIENDIGSDEAKVFINDIYEKIAQS